MDRTIQNRILDTVHDDLMPSDLIILSEFKSWPPLVASSIQLLSVVYTRWVPWATATIYIKKGNYDTSYMETVGLFFGADSADTPGLAVFKYGARMSILFLLLSGVISFQSIAMSIVNYSRAKTVAFREQLLLLVISVFCHMMALLVYLIVTVSSLGSGGYYGDGVFITALATAAGLVCFFMSYAANILIPIREQQLRSQGEGQ